MIHKMKLRSDPFKRIANGSKTIEIRLNDEKRQNIKVNDYIEFTNIENNEIVKVKVLKLHLFKSFEELFKTFDNHYFGYDDSYKMDYKKMYEYYSQEEENKYGVVGIEIKLVKGDE